MSTQFGVLVPETSMGGTGSTPAVPESTGSFGGSSVTNISQHTAHLREVQAQKKQHISKVKCARFIAVAILVVVAALVVAGSVWGVPALVLAAAAIKFSAAPLIAKIVGDVVLGLAAAVGVYFIRHFLQKASLESSSVERLESGCIHDTSDQELAKHFSHETKVRRFDMAFSLQEYFGKDGTRQELQSNYLRALNLIVGCPTDYVPPTVIPMDIIREVHGEVIHDSKSHLRAVLEKGLEKKHDKELFTTLTRCLSDYSSEKYANILYSLATNLSSVIGHNLGNMTDRLTTNKESLTTKDIQGMVDTLSSEIARLEKDQEKGRYNHHRDTLQDVTAMLETVSPDTHRAVSEQLNSIAQDYGWVS